MNLWRNYNVVSDFRCWAWSNWHSEYFPQSFEWIERPFTSWDCPFKGSCGSWILSTKFVVGSYGSWTSQIVLLWDPLDLGSWIQGLSWDPMDLGSCTVTYINNPLLKVQRISCKYTWASFSHIDISTVRGSIATGNRATTYECIVMSVIGGAVASGHFGAAHSSGIPVGPRRSVTLVPPRLPAALADLTCSGHNLT